MGWFWAILALLFFGMTFIDLVLHVIQVAKINRLIEIHDTNNFYTWMHSQPEFRSLNRVRTADSDNDRALVYSWTVAYVRDRKHHETEKAFSPKMAIRMFQEAIK